MEHITGMKVYVRVRPAIGSEKVSKSLKTSARQICLSKYKQKFSFTFDSVFNESSSTLEVFETSFKQRLESLVEGENLSYFTYGMTGAGKTFTMSGENGLMFQAVSFLLKYSELHLSYLEVYNEQVRDLLSQTSKNLSLLEDPNFGVFVPELTEHFVKDTKKVEDLIGIGNHRRAVAQTKDNAYSSRSHAILQVILPNKAKLSLIDLAGSERSSTSGQTGKEGASINKSLLALCQCIHLLAGPKHRHIPYRNSKLTRLLKDSLGGQTSSIMLACVSPAVSAKEETLNTLKYAERAQLVKKLKKKTENKVKVDEEEIDLVRKIIFSENSKHVLQVALAGIKTLEDNKLKKKLETLKKKKKGLSIQNEQIKIENQKAMEEIRAKDDIIKQMRSEIDCMKRKMSIPKIQISLLDEERKKRKMMSVSPNIRTKRFLESYTPHKMTRRKKELIKKPIFSPHLESTRQFPSEIVYLAENTN